MTTLYELSVDNYKRILASTIAVMEKGADYFTERGTDLNEIVTMQLADDMAAFPFQVNSVRHHSLGAANGLLAAAFSPPPDTPELDYHGLKQFLADALAEVEALDADVINAVAGKTVLFSVGEYELPFTAENFVQSFSLPNLYFHATTIYDMLRIKGVPLSKMDFLGNMSMGVPES